MRWTMSERRVQFYLHCGCLEKENQELYAINQCEGGYHLRQDETKEPRANGKQWKHLIGEKRSRGKFALGLGAMRFEHKIMQILRRQEDLRENLLKEAAVALRMGQEWLSESPHKEEVALLRESRKMHLPGMMVRRAVKARLGGRLV